MSGEPRKPMSLEMLAMIRARIEARLAGPPEFETRPCRRCRGPVQSEMDVDLSLCTRCRDVLYVRESTVRCPRCKSTFLWHWVNLCPYCGWKERANTPKGGRS